MRRRALFVTSLRPSLGETYSAVRFASGLRGCGWQVEFLASEFAAAFLGPEALPSTVLGASARRNRALLLERAMASNPGLVVTADWFLFAAGSGDSRPAPMGEGPPPSPAFDPNWLLDLDCPVATLDHMGFHPGRRTLRTGFCERLSLTRPPPRGAEGPPRLETTIPELPDAVAAVIRPCPLHSARPPREGRCVKFPVIGGRARTDDEHCRARESLGLSPHEQLVVAPLGTWSGELCRELGIPYGRLFPSLILDYLAATGSRVRVVFVGAAGGDWPERRGRVVVERLASASLQRTQVLLSAADLVIADNATSSFLGRAVASGVPAAVATSSLSIERGVAGIGFRAPFPISEAVGRLLREIDAEARGSVFPYLVYPLGWREELAPLFQDNAYADSLWWLELFDEQRTTELLEQLLHDEAVRGALLERAAAYLRDLETLPGPCEIAESIEGRTGSARLVVERIDA
jgi:hypothetical protein